LREARTKKKIILIQNMMWSEIAFQIA